MALSFALSKLEVSFYFRLGIPVKHFRIYALHLTLEKLLETSQLKGQ